MKLHYGMLGELVEPAGRGWMEISEPELGGTQMGV